MHFALISYLNARPLWRELVSSSQARGHTFEFTSPARCADLIASGSADLGLIPAIELAKTPDLVAIPGICIASKREVRSVLLVSRVPMSSIESVALDPSSRTSVALARILLGEILGRDRYRELRFVYEPDERRLLDLHDADAAVVIGDKALQVSKSLPGGVRFRFDLVHEWYSLFREPFVFAVWAGRRDRLERFDPAEVLRDLLESRDAGLANLDKIAQEAAPELGLPQEELTEYLTQALHYDLGEPEIRALARFHKLAAEYSLVSEAKDIEWLTNR